MSAQLVPTPARPSLRVRLTRVRAAARRIIARFVLPEWAADTLAMILLVATFVLLWVALP